MDLRKLQRIVIDALEDIKGQDIRVYDTQPVTDLFDRVVLVSGTSNRQTRSMASHVRDKVKQAGGHVISVEGEETGEWVLVDLGDIVVHVMQPAIRAYYNLEELWGAKPVKVRLGAPSLPAHAQGDDDTPARPARAGRTAAPKAASPSARKATGKAKPSAVAPAAGDASPDQPVAKPSARRTAGAKGGARTGAKAGAGKTPGATPASGDGAAAAVKKPRAPRAAKPRGVPDAG